MQENHTGSACTLQPSVLPSVGGKKMVAGQEESQNKTPERAIPVCLTDMSQVPRPSDFISESHNLLLSVTLGYVHIIPVGNQLVSYRSFHNLASLHQYR